MTTCHIHNVYPVYSCIHCSIARAETAEATVEIQRVEIERLRAALTPLVNVTSTLLTDWVFHDEDCDYTRNTDNVCSCEFETVSKQSRTAMMDARTALASKPAPGAGAAQGKAFHVETVQAAAREACEEMTGLRYRHCKGGIYEVLSVCVHEVTGDILVIYQSESKDYIWVCKLEVFLDQFPVVVHSDACEPHDCVCPTATAPPPVQPVPTACEHPPEKQTAPSRGRATGWRIEHCECGAIRTDGVTWVRP